MIPSSAPIRSSFGDYARRFGVKRVTNAVTDIRLISRELRIVVFTVGIIRGDMRTMDQRVIDAPDVMPLNRRQRKYL